MSLRIATGALLAAALAAEPPEDAEPPVTVLLRNQTRAKALSIRTEGRLLVLALPEGGARPVPLSQVRRIDFGWPLSPTLRNLLKRLRANPFADSAFDRLLDRRGGRVLLPAGKRRERAETLARHLASADSVQDDAQGLRMAMNLAALRFSLGDAAGSREALATAQALAKRAGDRKAHDEACARMAALQLPEGDVPEESPVWRRCRDAFVPGEGGGKEALATRIGALERLAREAGR